MAEQTHAARFAAAQADYHSAVGHDPHRAWATILFLLTATDEVWRAYRPHLTYTSETAIVQDAPHVSPDAQLVVSVAQNLAEGFATASTRTVDLAACCLQLNDQTFEVVVAACRMLRGDSGAARKVLES